MAKAQNINARGMKDEEIGIALDQYRSQLVSLRTQAVTEKVEDNSLFTKVRRDIARLKTERTARLLAKSPRAKAPAAPAVKAKAPASKAAPKRAPRAKATPAKAAR